MDYEILVSVIGDSVILSSMGDDIVKVSEKLYENILITKGESVSE